MARTAQSKPKKKREEEEETDEEETVLNKKHKTTKTTNKINKESKKDAIAIRWNITQGESHPFYQKLHDSVGFTFVEDIIELKQGKIDKSEVKIKNYFLIINQPKIFLF